MADGIKVTVDNSQAEAVLRGLSSSLRNLRPAFEDTAKELTKRIKFRFDFKRDPDNRRWAPWAKSTAEGNKGKPGNKLMLRSRALRNQSRFVAGSNLSIQAVLGAAYGIYHEQPGGGSGIGRKKLPRRAFLLSNAGRGAGLGKSDEAYLLRAIDKQLSKAAGD